MKPWHIAKPSLYEEFVKCIDSKYATLNVSIVDDIVFVKGTLFVKSKKGKELGRYAIEIRVPTDFPESIPVLRYLGNEFQKIDNRHFNSKDGTACLFFRDEKFRYFPEGATIADFIEGPIKSFFLWQIDYDLNGGKSSLGERKHGTEGLFQFYMEELEVVNYESVLRFLILFVAKANPRSKRCYCGSGNILKDCHLKKFMDLKKKISRRDAKQSLKEIGELIRLLNKKIIK